MLCLLKAASNGPNCYSYPTLQPTVILQALYVLRSSAQSFISTLELRIEVCAFSYDAQVLFHSFRCVETMLFQYSSCVLKETL